MPTKTSFRFRFSLRALLMLTVLLSVVGGVWVGMIEPIRNEWRTVEPILALGGRTETKPSNLPNWLEGLLPEGKTENIEAVFFNYKPATDEAISALEKLPHLRRLYVERSNLQPHHIDSIAKLKQLRRLSIWSQQLKTVDLKKLSQLKNLDIIDIHDCYPADWRTLLAFRDHSKTKIIHSFYAEKITAEEIDELLSIKHLLISKRSPYLASSDVDDLKKLRERFPEPQHVTVEPDRKLEEEYFRKCMKLCQANPFGLTVYPGWGDVRFPDKQLQERAVDIVRQAWEQLGPQCKQLIIKTDSGHPHNSYHLTFCCPHTEETNIQIGISFGNEQHIPPQYFESLPPLPNIESLVFQAGRDQLVGGVEHVLAKLPNLTQVESNSAYLWHRSFWQALAKMRNIEKLTINTNDSFEHGLPENFPNDFAFRETLKQLSVKVNDPKSEELEKIKSAFPNLQSFNGKELKKLEQE